MRTKHTTTSRLALAALISLLLPAPRSIATTVTNQLTVHLKFDGNLSDSTTNGIDGTSVALGTVSTNGVTFVPGFLGQAVHIVASVDGTTNDYVSLGYPPLLHFGSDATSDTTDFSIAMWVRIFSSQADEPLISNKDWDSSGNIGWIIANENDGVRVQLKDDTNPSWDMVGHAGPQLEDGTWHHLVVTLQRTNLASTYVDGSLVNTFSIAPPPGNMVGSLETDSLPVPRGPGWAINLGEDGTGLYPVPNGAAIDCLIDDFGMWRRAITTAEVQEIYNKAAVAGQTLEIDPGVLFTVIQSPPTNLTVTAGVQALLAVGAAGQPPLAYQWSKDGRALPQATNAVYQIAHTGPGDAGAYSVIVSGAGGTKSAGPAHLTVLPPSRLCSLTDGLAAYLKFDGDLNDSSTNGVDGSSSVGASTFVPGMVGQAVHVISTGDLATNDYVTLGYPDALKFGTNDFSICFWAKEFSQNDDKPFISNKNWNSGGSLGWVIASQTAGLKWNLKDDISSRRDGGQAASQLLDHQWHHIAVVFQRASVGRVYVDGLLNDVQNLAPDTTNAVGSADTDTLGGLSVNIGQDGTGMYTDGSGFASIDTLMDELAIWRRALTPDEVVCIYTHGLAGKSIDAPNVIPVTIYQPAASGASFQLSWFGNASSYILQKKTTLHDLNWVNVQTNSASNASVPIAGATGFFRVVSQ